MKWFYNMLSVLLLLCTCLLSETLNFCELFQLFGYYFLYCTSTDKDTIKKDLETIDIDSPLLVYDSYIVYLAFNTYELKYSDEKIEKNVKEIVDEALKARSEEREG